MYFFEINKCIGDVSCPFIILALFCNINFDKVALGVKGQIQLIARILGDIPSAEFTIGSGWGVMRRRGVLARFLLEEAMLNDGVFVDQSGQGIVLFYRSDDKRVLDWKAKIRLVLFGIGPFRIFRVMKRKRQVERMRRQYPPHIYCSFLGVLHDARGSRAVVELRDILFQKSTEWQLPIMVETVIIKNKIVYERMGFQTYGQFEVNGMITYCLIRPVNQMMS
jgi:hypothetical protein